MLNKIENISLKPDMRNEIKNTKKESGLNKVYKRGSFADTLTYSEALIFLSNLNWKLRKLNISSDEELEIAFQFENFEFNFLINTKSNLLQSVNVKITDINVIDYSSLLKFTIELSFIYRDNQDEIEGLEVLNNIFSKVKSYYIPSENEINSKYYFNIFYEQEEKLSNVLSKFLKNILIFIEKLNQKRITFGSVDNLQTTNLIEIKGIKIEK